MNLLDILSLESTIVDLKGESKEDIIAELVNSLPAGDAITDREQVLQAVLDREKIMSTGIGDGIAIPHGKSAAVTELVAAMGTQRRGVDFDAPRRRASLCILPAGLPSQCLWPPHQGTGADFALAQKRRVQKEAHRSEFSRGNHRHYRRGRARYSFSQLARPPSPSCSFSIPRSSSD